MKSGAVQFAPDTAVIRPLQLTSGIIIGTVPDGDAAEDLHRVASLPRECKVYADDGTDLYLGQHMAVFTGDPDASSIAFTRTNICQSVLRGDSVIAVGRRNGLPADTAAFARGSGYAVRVFNPLCPLMSDEVRFLHNIRRERCVIEADARTFADTLLAGTEKAGGHLTPEMAAGERSLLAAAVLYVIRTPTCSHSKYPPTLAGACRVLSEPLDTLYKLFTRLLAAAPDCPAAACWSEFTGWNRELQEHMHEDLCTRLSAVQAPPVTKITGSRTAPADAVIDLALPGREKCAYFVVMDSSADSRLGFLVPLFISQLVDALTAAAFQRKDRHLPVNVNIILDGFTEMPRIHKISRLLDSARAAGISISMLCSSMAALDAAYPGQAEAVIDRCSAVLCMSCQDTAAAELMLSKAESRDAALLSERTGRVDTVISDSDAALTAGIEDLSTPGGILRASSGKVVAATAYNGVFAANPLPYTALTGSQRLESESQYCCVPLWRKAEPAGQKERTSAGIGNAAPSED